MSRRYERASTALTSNKSHEEGRRARRENRRLRLKRIALMVTASMRPCRLRRASVISLGTFELVPEVRFPLSLERSAARAAWIARPR